MDTFWTNVEESLDALETAQTADQVIGTLNRYCEPSSGEAFFPGDGGDRSVYEALAKAGWSIVEWRGLDYWCAMGPDGRSLITYVEGDIYRGNEL